MAETTYIWRSEKGKNTCDECKALDGKIFKNKEEAPQSLHPNCKCELEPIIEEAFKLKKEKRKKRTIQKLSWIGSGDFSKKIARHFYDGNGRNIDMNFDEIKDTPILFDLAERNVEKYFTESINGKRQDNSINVKNKLENLKDGESITFTTHWDSATRLQSFDLAGKDLHSASSIGSGQVGSNLEVKATLISNTINITGKSYNSLKDIYDFDNSDYHYAKNEYEAQREGTGQPFEINADWISRFSGAATKYSDGSIGNAVIKEYTLDEDNK